MELINVGIAGCLGRMGQELVKKSITDSRINFVGGYEHKNHEAINNNLSQIINCETNLKVSANSELIFQNSDVVIDFTVPSSTSISVDLAHKTKTPLVIGTTGLDENTIKKIRNASNNIAILQSSNMSLSANLLLNLVQQTASVLDDTNYDIEISESHHKYKIDAPSGTALSLGKRAAKGRNSNFDEVKILNRMNQSTKRKTGQIGFAVTRGGEIVGEHNVSFIGVNDRINLEHKASNRSIFVQGAIEAAIFIYNKKNGLYSINDVIEYKQALTK